MSHEEVVRALFDAWSHDDLDAMLAVAHPELRFWPQGTLELTGRHEPYAGHEGIRQYFRDAGAGWTSLRLDPRDVRVAGDGVIVFGVVNGVTSAGDAIDRQAIWVFKIRDGLIVSLRAVATAEEAAQRVAAAG